jgi:hypothetical protein
VSPLERRCRLLLRAWPWRDRWERGDELVGTMLDVIGEGREWPPPGLAVDMVVGGIRAHRRRRPPLPTYLWFLHSGRLEYRWHEWMLDRLLAPGWRRRLTISGAMRYLTLWLPIWLAFLSVLTLAPWGWLFPVTMTAFFSLTHLVAAERARAVILKNHGYSLEGSPPRVVSHLVWAKRHERIANIRLAPVMAAASLPLIGAGVLALLDRMSGPDGPTFLRRHLLLVYVLLAVLVQLAAVWRRAHRAPAGQDRPTALTGLASVVTATALTAVDWFFLSVLPSGALGFAGGALGIATAVLAGALLVDERRIGRRIGLWDVYPSLGPRTATVVGQRLWWPRSSPSLDGRGQRVG